MEQITKIDKKECARQLKALMNGHDDSLCRIGTLIKHQNDNGSVIIVLCATHTAVQMEPQTIADEILQAMKEFK